MNKSNLCRYPFDSIAIKQYDTDGNPISAWPCCMMGNNTQEEVKNNSYEPNKLKFSKQDLKNLTPDELFNHTNFKKLRQDFLDGVRNPACNICWEQEDRKIKSYRQYSLQKVDMDAKVNNVELETIDLSINNLCNLACRMCVPSSSSLLMRDYNFFKKNKLLDRVSNSVERWGDASVNSFKLKDQTQWKWIMDNVKDFKNLKFRLSGGEPFYNNDVLNFLDKCIAEKVSQNISLEFHTNATLFDEELIKKIKHFKTDLNFSIDGHGKVYEYIRYPATWEQLDNSVRLFLNSIEQEHYNFNCVMMITNIFNIPDYINWIKSLGKSAALNFAEVHFHTRGTSLKNLSPKLLKQAKAEIIKAAEGTNLEITNAIQLINDAMLNNTENRAKALDEITLFDLSRNQNFEDYLDHRIIDWLKK